MLGATCNVRVERHQCIRSVVQRLPPVRSITDSSGGELSYERPLQPDRERGSHLSGEQTGQYAQRIAARSPELVEHGVLDRRRRQRDRQAAERLDRQMLDSCAASMPRQPVLVGGRTEKGYQEVRCDSSQLANHHDVAGCGRSDRGRSFRNQTDPSYGARRRHDDISLTKNVVLIHEPLAVVDQEPGRRSDSRLRDVSQPQEAGHDTGRGAGVCRSTAYVPPPRAYFRYPFQWFDPHRTVGGDDPLQVGVQYVTPGLLGDQLVASPGKITYRHVPGFNSLRDRRLYPTQVYARRLQACVPDRRGHGCRCHHPEQCSMPSAKL